MVRLEEGGDFFEFVQTVGDFTRQQAAQQAEQFAREVCMFGCVEHKLAGRNCGVVHPCFLHVVFVIP